MEFEKLCLKRFSCREYTNESIKNEELEKLLQAGMNAPVAKGKYENITLHVLSESRMKELREICIRKTGRDITYGATMCIVVAHKGENDVLVNQDTGCILENMCLEAENIGLGSVFSYSIGVAIEQDPEVRKLFAISENEKAPAGVFIGHKKDLNQTRDEHKMVVVIR